MKIIVISGINLFGGGPLSIYYDLLDSLIELNYNQKYEIIAFVHKKNLFNKYRNNINFIELPKSRKNYLFRVYYEYIYFYFWSKKRNIDYWLSLHDMTPNVIAKERIVYCHNPSIFYKPSKLDYKLNFKNILFVYFYKYIYKINIKDNKYVIVQQNWIKKEFENIYKIKNVIVSKPFISTLNINNSKHHNQRYYFIFPSFPRSFKNFEIICEACKILNDNNYKYTVLLTLNGKENEYSKYIYEKYLDVKNINWIGLQEREKLFRLYSEVDCLIFPSKLETWGLPISEFRCTGKKMILSDLPYAHETVGEYKDVSFFNCNDAKDLAKKMLDCILDRPMDGNKMINENDLIGWKETIGHIID